ncbi:hypothetical protein NG798_26330 [Ancylothrix sp. C2]|uniref:hypothetical protein n=1 Tax=Ancylothrix sp. D3o TaxID=2953691 RepID=UPI0021BAD31E|nr:hypothetical protein [Ancylothrix sp. D3o]MCT7953321.1 hypothetical protein [Ancylothrix sp. D3o]
MQNRLVEIEDEANRENRFLQQELQLTEEELYKKAQTHGFLTTGSTAISMMVGATTGPLIFPNPTPSISIAAGGILIGIPLAGVLTIVLNKIMWSHNYEA